MKKTKAINLASRVYLFETDAFDTFTVYYDMIKNHFRRYENSEKKVEDMEFLIADIFDTYRKSDTGTIKNEHVKQLIKKLGYSDKWDREYDNDKKTSSTRDTKRFSLDQENKMIAGVCGGISVYFKIDLSLVRVFTCIFTLFFPPLFILYLVFWIAFYSRAQPKSQYSAYQKEMSFSTGLKQFGNGTKIFFGKFAGIILLSFSLLVIVSIIAGSIFFANIISVDLFDLTILSNKTQNLYIIALFISLIFPFLFTALLGVRLLTERGFPRYMWISMFSAWVGSIIFLSVNTTRLVDEFDCESSITKRFTLSKRNSRRIVIRSNYPKFSSKKIILFQPSVNLISSNRHDSVMIKVHYLAHGKDPISSERNAQAIKFHPLIQGNRITITNQFDLSKGAFFRNQQVRLDVYIPNGTDVKVKNFNRKYITLENRSFRNTSKYRKYHIKRLPKFSKELSLHVSNDGFVINSQ